MANVTGSTRSWYQNYYREKGRFRNDLLANPEVLFQHLAMQAAVIGALRRTTLDVSSAKVLDVGCGEGGSLGLVLQLRFVPENLHGIDVLKERVDTARRFHPTTHLVCGDASAMSFASEVFDLVMESTMFVQITEEDLADKIAREMVRVTRSGGYILLIDWRYGKFGDSTYRACSLRRVRRLFPDCELVCQTNGSLVPPVGRALSRHLPSAYFPTLALLPFLVGLKATLLRTPAPARTAS